MKPRARIPRRTSLRPGGKVRSRATRRMGLDDLANMGMDDLARACVMVRDRASYSVDTEKLTLRWFGKCRECERERGLQWSHIIGRGEASQMRWIPENAIAHCAGCHYSWHLSPLKARTRAVAMLGEPQVARLESLKRSSKPDHALQGVANKAWLKAHGPHALDDLKWLWEQRALRTKPARGRKGPL